MSQRFNLAHLSAGFTTILIGYTAAVIIIVQAATNLGATEPQLESWLLALGIAMGVCCIALSWYYKMPILAAWSTPGAALIASDSHGYSLEVAVGAFIVSGLLLMLTAFVRPISRALAQIPSQLGTAMLGAIILPFCLGAFETLSSTPWLFIIMLATFFIAKQFTPKYAMVVLLAVGLVCATYMGSFTNMDLSLSVSSPVWVTPEFDLVAILNLAIPLYLVTMLSQNLPGFAMMKSYGYEPPVKSILATTGGATMLFAPFGGFAINLAAITAAICMNEEVDKNKSQRFKAAIWAGVFYLFAGLFATSVVTLFLALPKDLAHILAGFALLGTLMMCIQTAFASDKYREAALLTFLVTLSGVSFLGISSTLWGLMIGMVYLKIFTQRKVKDNHENQAVTS